MTDFFYEPLNHLDASFLALETRSSHMHVTGVALFDASALQAEEGGIAIERIKSHIRSKLRYIPRYRQQLEWVPNDRRPVWVDDQHFNFDYHVRHISLPRPGSDQQLRDVAGNIPGPQFPMYLLESQMLANYPMVPLSGQQGLGAALFSYNGRLLWGVQADYDCLPDSDDFIAALHDSFAELQDLVGAA